MLELILNSIKLFGFRVLEIFPAELESEFPEKEMKTTAKPEMNGTPSSSMSMSRTSMENSLKKLKYPHDPHIQIPLIIFIMAYQLTSVNQLYTDAVNAIKTIKMSNQRMSKQCSHHQQQMIVNQAKLKAEKWIDTMDKNYIEPQTAHRLQIMKQQLKTEIAKHEKVLRFHEQQSRKQKETFESENNNEENMNDLEFDFEHENYLMKQRSRQLKQAHSKLSNINDVVIQTEKMTYQQGKQLDLIDENMSGSYINVQESNSYLAEANQEQKKSQQKYGCLLIFCGVVLILIVGCFYFLA